MEIKIFWQEEDKIRWAKELLREQGYMVRDKQEVQKNIAKARTARQKTILQKIEKAKLELAREGKDINPHSISKQAKINYRTALKYV